MASNAMPLFVEVAKSGGGFAAEGTGGGEWTDPKSDDDDDDDDDNAPPPRPEDAIPDLPENAAARAFLKTAPTRGLWQPLGAEVRVMQCYRCKAYGHKAGEKTCPLFAVGNVALEAERTVREDPMAVLLARKRDRAAEKKGPAGRLEGLVAALKDEGHRKRKREEKKLKKRIRRLETEAKDKKRQDKKKKKKKKRKKKRKKDTSSSLSSSSSSSSDSSSSDGD